MLRIIDELGDATPRVREKRTAPRTGNIQEFADAALKPVSDSALIKPLRPLVLIGAKDAGHFSRLAALLTQKGFRTILATDGAAVLDAASQCRPHLIMLEGSLPPTSGVAVCRALRLAPYTQDVPIIVVATEQDHNAPIQVVGTEGDDVSAKPIAKTQTMAHAENELHRTLRFADVEMNLTAYRTWRDGRELHLAPTEFRLLRHLMAHPGRVFSRTELVQATWRCNVHVEPRTVDVHMGRLRKALKLGGGTDLIRTVRAVGYALSE